MAETILPLEHVKTVCRLGHGERCCAYLVAGGPNMTWACAKEIPDIAAAIRQRLSAGTMVAQGDNCAGPPTFARGEDG